MARNKRPVYDFRVGDQFVRKYHGEHLRFKVIWENTKTYKIVAKGEKGLITALYNKKTGAII